MLSCTLDEIMDIVSSDQEKGQGPKRSANWLGGKDSRTLQAYTGTISSLARNAVDMCGGIGDVVEIGTDYGLSTFAMAYAIRWHVKRKVFTFDIRPDTVINARERAKRLGIETIEFIEGTSFKAADHGYNFCFAYIDGNHSYQGCYDDLCNLAPLMHEKGIMLCHDLHRADLPVEKQNGVRTAITTFTNLHKEWSAMQLWGWGLLGRNLTR